MGVTKEPSLVAITAMPVLIDITLAAASAGVLGVRGALALGFVECLKRWREARLARCELSKVTP